MLNRDFFMLEPNRSEKWFQVPNRTDCQQSNFKCNVKMLLQHFGNHCSRYRSKRYRLEPRPGLHHCSMISTYLMPQESTPIPASIPAWIPDLILATILELIPHQFQRQLKRQFQCQSEHHLSTLQPPL